MTQVYEFECVLVLKFTLVSTLIAADVNKYQKEKPNKKNQRFVFFFLKV